eukprot:m.63280 g.63280  ORF g.63280 m.63280 type:complete len:224 (+) comp11572_c0_seq3:183-854(+)
MTVQDERYLNYYIWREYKNPDKNIRILSHSYLYPYRSDGFGEWVTKKHRPIIYHGIYKTPGKLVQGEIQFLVKSTKMCIGYFLRPKVGLFGCHGGGGMQGWVIEDKAGLPVNTSQSSHMLSSQTLIQMEWPPSAGTEFRMRAATSYSYFSDCLDGSGDKNNAMLLAEMCSHTLLGSAGDPARISLCRRTDWDRLAWTYNEDTGSLQNKASGLCLDAAQPPPHK